MTDTDTDVEARVSASDRTENVGRLRTVGRAGLGYVVVYGTVVAVNQGLNLLDRSPVPEYPTAEQMAAGLPLGSLRAIIFAAAAVLAVIALSNLAGHLRRTGKPLATALPALVGAIAVGELGAGFAGVTQAGFVNEYLRGSGADAAAQSAVIQGLYVVPQTFAGITGFAFAGYLVISALVGRGTLPAWLNIVSLIFAAATLGTAFLGFSVGVVLLLPWLLLVGLWALRGSRAGAVR